MIGMSIFDMFSSTAYMLVGVMAPYDAGFYLSRGNITTCKIQGCMIQLGQTGSMLYNLFLSLFFFFVIVFGWREQRFKKMIVWVHMVVVLTSVALAAAVIPFVQAQFGVCGILPPLTSSQWQISLFYTGPVVAVLLVLDTTTATICRRTYLQQQRARKWQLGNSNIDDRSGGVLAEFLVCIGVSPDAAVDAGVVLRSVSIPARVLDLYCDGNLGSVAGSDECNSVFQAAQVEKPSRLMLEGVWVHLHVSPRTMDREARQHSVRVNGRCCCGGQGRRI